MLLNIFVTSLICMLVLFVSTAFINEKYWKGIAITCYILSAVASISAILEVIKWVL